MNTPLQNFQQELARTTADGALISSELNQRYLTDFSYTDGYLLITPDKAYLLADSRYTEAARAEVKNFEIVAVTGGMVGALADLIRTAGLSTVAVEDATLSCADFQRLSAELPCTLNTGASSMLSKLRQVKLPFELERIAKAQEITDAAFAHILGYISPDVTERDVALELEFFMRRHGAEATAFDTIAVSGASSSLPHGVPADRKLQCGFLTMDFGAKYRGYCSDMTRTVVIGHASEEMKQVYSTVLRAQSAALEALHEGISCREADRVARDVIDGAGYGGAFGHSLGHGVGLYIHESPSLSPRALPEVVLRRGNVVTVEPGIYLTGKFGCRIEDMVAVEHDGRIRNFTQSSKQLIEL